MIILTCLCVQVNITICLPVRDSDVFVSCYAKWSMYTHEYKMSPAYKDMAASGGDDKDEAAE